MPQPTPPSPRAVSRRALLAGGTAVGTLGLLTSCSRLAPDGTSSGGTSSGGTAPGPPLPGDLAPLTPYADLAAHLDAAADGFSALAATPHVASSTVHWAGAAAAMCRAQAQPLRTQDPLSGTLGPVARPSGVPSLSASPAPTPAPASQLATMAARQRSLVAQFRSRCLIADAGDLALLLGSLTVSAHAVRGPSPAPAPTRLAPGHLDVGTRDAALTVLLTRVGALEQGLEVGLGSLPPKDGNRAAGERRLSEVWALRDDVENRLVRASAAQTPGPLVYHLPGSTDSPAAVRALWGRLESDVMAAWLRVAAASADADRGVAVDAAVAQQDRAAALGTPVTWWPGWV